MEKNKNFLQDHDHKQQTNDDQQQQQQQTTSIVDISEMSELDRDDNDDTVAMMNRQHYPTTTPTSNHNHDNDNNRASATDHRHHQHNQHSSATHNNQPVMQRPRSACSNMTRPADSSRLYLYHEDLPENRRIPNLLSAIVNLDNAPMTGINDPMSISSSMPNENYDLTALGSTGQIPAIDYRGESAHTDTGGASNNFNNQHQQQLQQNKAQQPLQTPPTPTHTLSGDQQQAIAKANLGTLSGVYFPCVQNIFGVILFIRMVWIVGTAGVPAAFTLVFICCCVTLCTSISLSAIATNGIVPAGGSYFMISRSLGPEFGGAVGTMFFLGTTVAGAMYTTGAVEIMLNYMSPQLGLFGDFQRSNFVLYNNIRVYGTLLLILIGCIVLIGVKFVSRFAPVALFCVLFSIICIYAGIFINYDGKPEMMICVVKDRLVTLKNVQYPPNQALFQSDEQQQQLLRQQNGQYQATQQQPNYEVGYNQEPASSLASGDNSSSSITKALTKSELELKRMKTLCTFEALKPVFCNQSALNHPALTNSNNNNDNQQRTPTNYVSNNNDANAHHGKALPIGNHTDLDNCDDYFKANADHIHLEQAVPGISSGIILQNLSPRFRNKETIVGYDEGIHTGAKMEYVFVDITTSFTILLSIYFPSCTGILAGSNRSGDLADAQKSIPLGTISAQLTTSFIYLSSTILFGSSFNNLFIRDKLGESVGGQLAVTQIAWPHPYVVLAGALLSTLGAALQSLVGAPRLLQAIAKDQVIPCLNCFAKSSPSGEPTRAILLSLILAECAVLIGNIDLIAPILALSLVMCYLFVNLACTLQSLLKSPNWRPRFKHYHWSISLLGCFLCLFVMVVSSWIYTVIAMLLAGMIYKYIEFHGAEKEWGDGFHGLALSAARYSLLRLETGEPHIKNWRPQILLFCKLKPTPPVTFATSSKQQQQQQPMLVPKIAIAQEGDLAMGSKTATSAAAALIDIGDSLVVAHPKLLTFASQLKAGKGLTLVSSIIEGDFKRLPSVAVQAKSNLQETMQLERVKGFADVLVAPSIMDGVSYQVQTAGLGGLKHNTVILGWPQRWRARPSSALGQAPATSMTGESGNKGLSPPSRAHLFIETMRTVQASQNALLVVKGIDSWPESCDKLGGYIDIWWIVHDGGLLMLLPHLLKQHRTWKSCQLRVFTVAQPEDNSIQMRDDLKKFLYHLRIEAQVDIVEMGDSEISDYAYERTLMMEQRSEIIKRLNQNRKQSVLLEQVDGRVIRFTIRKPSATEYEDTIYSDDSTSRHRLAGPYPMVGFHDDTSNSSSSKSNKNQQGIDHKTLNEREQSDEVNIQEDQQSTSATGAGATSNKLGANLLNLKPDEANVRRMHTAIRLNEVILNKSRAAKLVILNMPGAPKTLAKGAESNYMEFIEVLTEGIERVLLVQGSGREVITIHS